jgi:hypothetical protein
MKQFKTTFTIVLFVIGLHFGLGRSYGAQIPQWAIDTATAFESFHTIVATTDPRIARAHTQFYEIYGIFDDNGTDREALVIVGGSELSPEVVGDIKLCFRYDDRSDTNNYTEAQVITIVDAWMSLHGFTPPSGFTRGTPVLRQVGEELRWETFWRHNFSSGADTGRVLSDFILVGVDAEEGDVIAYSKVHHPIAVDTDPDITQTQAVTFARGHLDVLGFDQNAPHLSTELSVVYPNDYFANFDWEWNDNQHLCWIVQFGGTLHPSEPGVEIWVEANGSGGELLGGQQYKNPTGELYGIPDQEDDVDRAEELLEGMQYNLTGKVHKGNTTEAAIRSSISETDNTLFILSTHGGAWDNLEHAVIDNNSSGDAMFFSSDEVPDHTLNYALMSCCHSGDEEGDNDFKDEFINHYIGGSYFLFQGYEGTVAPDWYEKREFYHLAMGRSIENAHETAKAETGFTGTVVFAYTGNCYNKVKLAPLWVDVTEEPEEDHLHGVPFRIYVDVRNWEAAGYTEATGVTVQLEIPAGFLLASGTNPQVLGNIASGSVARAEFWLLASTASTGTHTFDAVVWSDNLGVELDDPDEYRTQGYYHREDVNIIGPECDVSPDWLYFGSVPVGDYSEKTFTVTNTGQGTLQGNISNSFCNVAFSIQSGGGDYSLGPGEFVEVTVRYEPQYQGSHVCEIETDNVLCSDVSCSGSSGGDGIPTVSEWGLIVMLSLMLIAGTLIHTLRRVNSV